MLAEHLKADAQEPADATVLAFYHRLHHIAIDPTEHAMQTGIFDRLPLRSITEQQLYVESISTLLYRDHHSTLQWQEFLAPAYLEWRLIWRNVHNPLASERTKSIIWNHLHLNFPTTHSFNKWHHTADPCPFCHHLPESAMHIILLCPFVRDIWRLDLHPFLDSIHPAPLTDYEMAFGLDGQSAPILLRNWLTFHFRCIISSQEILASNTPGLNNSRMVKDAMNRDITAAVHRKYVYCTATQTLPFFTTHFQCVPDFVVIRPDEFGVLTVFPN